MKKDISSINISTKFQLYVSELEEILHPELKKEIKNLREIDLHDYFFSPKHFFSNEIEAKGFIWSLFRKQNRKKITMIQKADKCVLSTKF